MYDTFAPLELVVAATATEVDVVDETVDVVAALVVGVVATEPGTGSALVDAPGTGARAVVVALPPPSPPQADSSTTSAAASAPRPRRLRMGPVWPRSRAPARNPDRGHRASSGHEPHRALKAPDEEASGGWRARDQSTAPIVVRVPNEEDHP